MITFLSSVIIFGVLIFFHELGHFCVAKRMGVGVIEFAVGFGPRLIGRQVGKTMYSLRIIPLGGFVRLAGVEDPAEYEAEGSYQKQPAWKRFAVIAAGPAMNVVLAVLLFSLIYFAYAGAPLYNSTEIGELLPAGPAEEAGLMEGDRILTINNETINNWHELVAIIHANPQRGIDILYERNGQSQTVTVIPERDAQTGQGRIGIGPVTRLYAFIPSLQRGISHTIYFIRFIVVSVMHMFTGRMAPDVVGPVGIIHLVGEVARTGVVNLLQLAAVISLNLGFINLLPIPAMDGSRLLFILVESIRGRPVDPKKESFIHFVGFTILMLLMIFIAYRDIARLNLF